MIELGLRGQKLLGAEPTSTPSHIPEQLRELRLAVRESDSEDIAELSKLVTEYVGYSSTSLAEIHSNAMKLGTLDSPYHEQVRQEASGKAAVGERCSCCKMKVQKEELKTTEQSVEELKNIGDATVVYFRLLIHLGLLLVAMVLCYSIFATVTNAIAASKSGFDAYVYTLLSLGGKAQTDQNSNAKGQVTYLVSAWLSLPMLIIWGLLHYLTTKKIMSLSANSHKQVTVADYSVYVQNAPIQLPLANIEELINNYIAQNQGDNSPKKVKIQKINPVKPFLLVEDQLKDEELANLRREEEGMKQSFRAWVMVRVHSNSFAESKQRRQELYTKYQANQKAIAAKYQSIQQNIQKQLTQMNAPSTSAFFTFSTVEQKQIFVNAFRSWKYRAQSLLSRGDKFKNVLGWKVAVAAQPQDVMWGNIGLKPRSYWFREFLIITAGLSIIGASFGIAYALQTQAILGETNLFTSLLGVVLTFSNYVIIKVMGKIITLQRPESTNSYQVSVAVKSIVAELINSIVTPIILEYIASGGQIYAKTGIIQNIFVLGITTAFMPPILRFIDPVYLVYLLRRWYLSDPYQRLGIKQNRLNRRYEKPSFQVGVDSIDPIGQFLFVCFFASLQPIISVFALGGIVATYWVEKRALFRKSQRPPAGSDLDNRIMLELVKWGGVLFALGNLTWSSFLPDASFRSSTVPNSICLALSLLVALFPYSLIVTDQTYQQRRLFFASEYDRANPTTSHSAIDEYKVEIQKRRSDILRLPKEKQEKIQKQLASSDGVVVHKGPNQNLLFPDSDDKTIAKIFAHLSKNSVHPTRLLPLLWPQKYDKSLERVDKGVNVREDLEKIHGSTVALDDIVTTNRQQQRYRELSVVQIIVGSDSETES